jgi:L-propargylglycine--L-glutamate ligase
MTDAAFSCDHRARSTGHADTLILIPSMSYSEGVLAAVPYARYFGERSLSDLGALRDPGVRVVLVNADRIDPWIIDQMLRELSGGAARHRDMRRRLRCLVPNASGHMSLADAVLADPQTMADLRDAVGGAKSALLVNFAASDATDELANRLGIPAEEGPADFADHWGTKSGSKTLFQESGVLCARGELDVVRDEAGVRRLARQLAAADPPAERVIVKLDAAEWASGIGNAVIHCATLERTGEIQRSVQRLLQPWEAYSRALAAGGAIVEEFIAGASSWPSAQGYVGRDGRCELLGVHEQILIDGEYLGCIFPVDQDIALEVSDVMMRLGATLERRGFRGSFGVDFIVVGERIYAMEVNLRKVGPSHVIKVVAAYVGSDATPTSRSIVGMPIAYVNRRLHDPELFTTLTPRSAFAALDRHRLTYDGRTETGTLLHIASALGPAGFVETTSIAKTPKHARDLDRRAEAALIAAARGARGGCRQGQARMNL